MDEKRLFFGFSVLAPWPDTYPKGRILEEGSRHLTLAFLGNCPYAPLETKLSRLPTPPFLIGPVGYTDHLEFLPEFKPRVVSQHVQWLSSASNIPEYRATLLNWIASLGYAVDKRPFLPHITVARAPFEERDWEEAFSPLPICITGISLFESIGNLRYVPLYSLPLLLPFEEFEHTADIAFCIRGHTLKELYLHGALALAFEYPPFLSYFVEKNVQSLDEVIRALSEMISLCDLELGCPFKAVSYHGKLKEEYLLEWEMIVDV